MSGCLVCTGFSVNEGADSGAEAMLVAALVLRERAVMRLAYEFYDEMKGIKGARLLEMASGDPRLFDGWLGTRFFMFPYVQRRCCTLGRDGWQLGRGCRPCLATFFLWREAMCGCLKV